MLVIPGVLAAGAAFFNWQSQKREKETRLENQRETGLQTYFDNMKDLLLKEKLLDRDPLSVESKLATFWTLTALSRLDPRRKTVLMYFLTSRGLVSTEGKGSPLIGLNGARLEGADLYAANLQGAILRSANLEEAHLRGAELRGANLFGANLQEAVLIDAKLQGANLRWANLKNAKLDRAQYDERTELPDREYDEAQGWSEAKMWNRNPEIDMTYYTDPEREGGFWRCEDPRSPAYRDKDGLYYQYQFPTYAALADVTATPPE